MDILDREQDWRKRGIWEAIYIRVNKPDLNRDQGRFNLHHAWDNLLWSRVSRFNIREKRDYNSLLWSRL